MKCYRCQFLKKTYLAAKKDVILTLPPSHLIQNSTFLTHPHFEYLFSLKKYHLSDKTKEKCITLILPKKDFEKLYQKLMLRPLSGVPRTSKQ